MELIDRIKDEDEKKASRAFGELFELIHQPLIFFTYSLTKDLQVAEDINSESFSKLWQLKHQFETTGKMKSFLYTICRNAAFDFLKNLRKPYRKYEVSVENMEEHEQALEEDLEYEMMRSVIMEAIYKEIDRLQPKIRFISKLSMIQGLTVAQIAKSMKIPEQSVRNNLTTARNLLRIRMKHLAPMLG